MDSKETRSKARKQPKASSSSVDQQEDIVYVSFTGLLDPQLIRSGQSSMRFFGLDTDEPVLQVGPNTFFQGKLDHVIGTCLFFEEKNRPSTSAAGGGQEQKKLVYVDKCDKTLNMKRIFLEPNEKPADS